MISFGGWMDRLRGLGRVSSARVGGCAGGMMAGWVDGVDVVLRQVGKHGLACGWARSARPDRKTCRDLR